MEPIHFYHIEQLQDRVNWDKLNASFKRLRVISKVWRLNLFDFENKICQYMTHFPKKLQLKADFLLISFNWRFLLIDKLRLPHFGSESLIKRLWLRSRLSVCNELNGLINLKSLTEIFVSHIAKSITIITIANEVFCFSLSSWFKAFILL